MSVLTLYSGGRAHLRQHLADGLHGAANAALAELSHAADTEGFQRGELPRIQDVTACLDGVVEALEGVARVLRCVERHDDRRLNRRRQEAAQAEPRHALD